MVLLVCNDIPGEFDTGHRDKLAEAVMGSVTNVSALETDAGRVLHLRTGEIADAFSLVLALLASSHKEAISPRDLRRLDRRDIEAPLQARCRGPEGWRAQRVQLHDLRRRNAIRRSWTF